MPTTTQAEIVREVNQIIIDYPDMRLTLRQIYYRLLSKQLFANTRSSYQRLGKILVKARLKGDVEFSAMEDRTRRVESGDDKLYKPAEYFNSYYDYLSKLDKYYTMPKWWGQPNKVVVMVEKDALSSVFREVTKAEGTDLVVCKGYPSITVLHDLAMKLRSRTKNIEILWFSDYDPSGKNIEETTTSRLEDDFNVKFNIERIALTKKQVKHYDLPPAPAKPSDPRYEAFIAAEGEAWQVELDALEPREMQRLIREAIKKHFNEDLKEVRDEKLEQRKRRSNKWVGKAFNPDFEKPKVDEDDEQAEEDAQE